MTDTYPKPNDALQTLLELLEDDPGAVSSDFCALPGCGLPYNAPWYVEFYRPPPFSEGTRCLSACSAEHHKAIINHFDLKPFMKPIY